tara:strand:- start:6612 stop:7586 length:975 start_codon:yes stop_codon:yes gene_type:complete
MAKRPLQSQLRTASTAASNVSKFLDSYRQRRDIAISQIQQAKQKQPTPLDILKEKRETMEETRKLSILEAENQKMKELGKTPYEFKLYQDEQKRLKDAKIQEEKQLRQLAIKRNSEVAKLKAKQQQENRLIKEQQEEINNLVAGGLTEEAATQKAEGKRPLKMQRWTSSDDVIVELDFDSDVKTIEGSFNLKDVANYVASGLFDESDDMFDTHTTNNYKYIFPKAGNPTIYMNDERKLLREDMIRINLQTQEIENLTPEAARILIYEASKGKYGKNITRPLNILLDEEREQEEEFEIERDVMFKNIEDAEMENILNTLSKNPNN